MEKISAHNMKKFFLIILFIVTASPLIAQVEVKDSVFVKINKLEPESVAFQISGGKIIGVDIYIY